MSAENLTAARFEETLIITSEDPMPELPTVVLALGPTLTAEINPNSNCPVRLASEDYARDKGRIEALLGADAVYRIEASGDGSYTMPFTPASAWDIVLDLAMQQWNLDWNPLPLDPNLLALDLLRAQHEAITLTGTLPDNWLAKMAYPAAQTLQRLLDAEAIVSEAQHLVTRCVEASRANTPLNHSDTTPYSLPVPLTPSEICTILDPAPVIPGALTTGSPDWHLTGHGPAATAENTITVLPHAANTAAITITTPVKPHTHPEKTPIYQALITDPLTGQDVASTNLRYVPEKNTYIGHTTPRRPIIATDQVDIRHPRIPTPPATTQEERENTYACRQATRAFVASFAGRTGTAVLAGTGKLLIDVSTTPQNEYRPNADLGSADAVVHDPKNGRSTKDLPAKEELIYIPTIADFALAASDGGPIRKEGMCEAGAFHLAWSRDASSGSLHIAVDIDGHLANDADLVMISIASGDTEFFALLVLRRYEGNFLVGDLKLEDPTGTVKIGLSPEAIRPQNFPDNLLDAVRLSILGSTAEGTEAWRNLVIDLPEGSLLRASIIQALP